MNNIDLARLRKLSLERGDTGGPESRDSLITAFLTQLEEVVCEKAVSKISDNILNCMYTRWVKAINTGEDEDQRKQRLINSVYFNPFVEPDEKLAENVKSIFG